MSFHLAEMRPSNYDKLPPEEQWVIDKNLGILDWQPTEKEIKEWKKKQKPDDLKRKKN